MQNGFVGRFNARMRDAFLNDRLFRTLARDPIAEWVADCNTARPYSPHRDQTLHASPCT